MYLLLEDTISKFYLAQNLFIFLIFYYIMEFQKVLDKRASVKKFSSKKPAVENIIEAIFVANMAPAAGNVPELIYLVVDDKEKIGKIADACQQSFIAQSPYLVIVCSITKQAKRLYDLKDDKYLKHNVGASVENFLLKIVDLGLASCWVGAFSEPTIKNTLGIPDSMEIEVVIPVGYELITFKTRLKQPKPKYSLVNRVFFNSWGNKFYKPLIKIRRIDV